MNKSANVSAPWKQKHFLAVCWLFFLCGVLFLCSASPFYVSNKLLLLFHFLFIFHVGKKQNSAN